MGHEEILISKLAEAKEKFGRTFRTDELSPRVAKKSDFLRKLERLALAMQAEGATSGVTVLQEYRKSAHRQG